MRTWFIVRRTANLVSITDDAEDFTIFKSWDVRDFTARKLKNAMDRIRRDLKDQEVIFIYENENGN
jgi:hypothetical protein